MKQEIVKGAQLTAINVCKMKRTGEESLTIGKVYEVLGVNYNEDKFWIKDDFNDDHSFDISDYTDFFESLNSKFNNGWIKIESEDDLPKNITECWINYKDKILLSLYQSKHFVLKSEFSLLPFNLITHYQPIEKPKPPIY